MVGLRLAGKVSRRGGKRHAAGFDDRLHHRMGRHAHADRIQPGTGHFGHFRSAGHDHGERAGPECGGQLFGAFRHFRHNAVQHFHAADMHDQRVILRAAFGFKNFFDSLTVAGIGGNAVHRFGRQSYQFPLLQQFGGKGNAFLINRQNLSIHRS